MVTSTKVNFKPLGNRVVIKPNEGKEQVSAGGIYIPDTAKEKPQEGRGRSHRAGQAFRRRQTGSPWMSPSGTPWSTPSTPAPNTKRVTRTT